MTRFLKALWEDESGVTAVEYGLIAGLMAALLVAVMGVFGEQLKALFDAIAGTLKDAAEEVKDADPQT